MKKHAKNTGKLTTRNRLDTVGVAGSIPVEPTIFKIPDNVQTIEIPADFQIIPAVEWVNGLPRMFRVLSRKRQKKCDKSVSGVRSKKTA